MKTTVIMEVGNNWESEQDILDSIEFGRSRGCLIKFQSHQGEFEHLKKYVIPKDLMKKIAADDVFYSVFSVEMVDWLEEHVKPRYYKLASRSFNDTTLIQRVADTGARVIMSVPYPNKKPDMPFEYLHCVAEYPASNAHLECLLDGLSDHTISTLVPALAVAKGCSIIEKHFSIREMQTPDRPHSLLPAQWDEMLENVKQAEEHCNL